ncbi:serine-rich adhesin for platelets-like [Palaemon carinicauda]|uniref:serine-rich adhesin for platelets-like n=1 Tax=Palaemon carinicauda TaxID=392227 RepID=UPI0035B60317
MITKEKDSSTTGFITTQDSSTSTPSAPLVSVKSLAKSAVSESQTELVGLLSDAEGGVNKRDVSGSSGEATVNFISSVTRFKNKVIYWTINFESLTFADIPTINAVTLEIKSMRQGVKNGSKVLLNRDKAEVKAVIKLTAIFIGDISIDIDEENRLAKLTSSSSRTKTVKTVIENIQTTAISIKNALGQQSSDSSSVSVGFVTEIIRIIEYIITDGASAITQSNLLTLTDYSRQLEDINVAEKLLLKRDLLSVTDAVKNSISQIITAKAAVAENATTTTHSISTNIIEVYSLLETSFESLTREQVEILNYFNSEAQTIVQLFETSNVEIIGFETIKRSNRELQKKAKKSYDDLFSRSSVTAKAEITSEAKQYIIEIIEAVKYFQSSSQVVNPQESLEIITNGITYLSSLDVESLSESTILELQQYSSQLTVDLDRALNNGFGVIGIENFLTQAESSLDAVDDKLNILSKSEEQIINIERSETAIVLLSTLETEISALATKATSSGSQSDTILIADIENVISEITEILVKISSKTYKITEANIIGIEEYIESFKLLANQTLSFTTITGFNEFESLVQITKEAVQEKKNKFTISFEAKKNLDTLEYIDSFLASLKAYLSVLTDSEESTLISANLIVSEIATHLTNWLPGISYVRRESVDELQGYLFSLKSQTTSGDEVQGVSGLISTVMNLETLTGDAKNVTRQDDQGTQANINLETVYNLVTEATTSFQQLIELTKDFQGSEVPYQEVAYIVKNITTISRKTSAITSLEVDELQQTLATFSEFITGGEIQEKILGLTDSFNQIIDAKKLLQKKLKKYEVDKVEIIKEISQLVNNTLKAFESKIIDISNNDLSEYEFITSDTIDEFYAFILRVEEQPKSLSGEDLQYLLTLIPKVQYELSSTSEYDIITGYSTNLTTVLEKADSITNLLNQIESEEEALQKDKENLSLYSDTELFLSEIIDSLGRLTEMDEDPDSDNTQTLFEEFSITLSTLSANISMFTDLSDLLKLLDILLAAEESNLKPKGTEGILSEAKDALTSVGEQLEAFATQSLIKFSIQQLNAVSDVTDTLERELKNQIDSISPQKLVGKPNEEIGNTIKFINSLRVDSISNDELEDLVGRFNLITLSLGELTDEEGAGNLIALKRSLDNFATKADRYKRQQLDRETVKEQLKKVQSSDEVLRNIKNELSNKIDIITSVNVIPTGNSEPKEIQDITSQLNNIFENTVHEANIGDLNETLIALTNLNVNAGEEVPGIFNLQSLLERSIYDVQTESQFLKSTELARKSIDILSASSIYIADIESQLQNIVDYIREDNTENEGITPIVLEEALILLGKTGNAEYSNSFLKDIEVLSNDLRGLNLQVKIDIKSVLEVLELTRAARYQISQTLENQNYISEYRHRIILYERLSGILSQVNETLNIFDANNINDGPQLVNQDIDLFFSLIQEFYETTEKRDRKIDLLGSVLEKVKNISSTELNGKYINGLGTAKTQIYQIDLRLQEELATSKKLVKLSAKKTTKLETLNIFELINSIANSKISSVGIATKEVGFPEVTDLQQALDRIDLDSVSFEDISDLKEKVNAFENIVIQEGNGIANLRDLISTVVSKTESTKQSSAVVLAVSKLSDSSGSLTITNEAFSQLERELSNVTISNDSQDDNKTDILLEILDAVDLEFTDSLESSSEKLKEITEKLQYVKNNIEFGSNVLFEINSKIKKAKKMIEKELTRSESKLNQLKQSTTLLDIQSKFKFISEKSEEILSTNQQITTTDEDIEDLIRKFILLFKRFKTSAIDVTDEDLTFISDNASKLNILFARNLNIKGIAELKLLSDSVLESSLKEIKASERDTKRDNRINVKTKQKTTVADVEILLKEIAQKTGVPTSTSTEVSIFEVEKISNIIKLIKDGTAKESDIEVLQGYTKSLSSLSESFSTDVNIKGLQDTLAEARSLQGYLEKSVTEDTFDSSYSETVYKQKVFKSLLLDTSDQLESLTPAAGDGNQGNFSHEIFKDLQKTLQRLQKGYSEQNLLLLRDQLQTLKSVKADIPENTTIVGLQELYRKTQSVIVSTESSISSSDMINLALEEVSNSKEAVDLISKIEKTTKELKRKSDSVSSGASKNITELDEIQNFFSGRTVYASKEIATLREYLALLNRYDKEITNEKLEGLDAIVFETEKQKLRLKEKINKNAQSYRSEKQTVYIRSASSQIKQAYNQLSGFRAPDLSAEVEEIEEVTRFSIFLQSIDIQSLSAVEISQISEKVSSFFSTISESSVKNIAYVDIITEKLTQLNYVAETQLKTKEAYISDQKISSSLKNSRTAIEEKSSQLYSLKQAASSQTFTSYEENTAITKLYYFLLPYTYDFRLINDDFNINLREFDLSSVSSDNISRGIGIKYLEEVSSLTEKLLAVEKQSSERAANLNSVAIAKDLQSSFSLLAKTLDQFTFNFESGENLDDASDTGIPGESPSDELSEEADQFESFKVIINYIKDISTGSKDFKSQESSAISERIRNLISTDIYKLFSRYGVSYIRQILVILKRVTVQVASSVDRAESDVKVQKSFTKIEDTLEILSFIKQIILKITKTKQGSSNVHSIIVSIKEILQRITNVHFISNEDVSNLRAYAYQLSVESTSTDSIELDEQDFEELLSSTYDSVESSYSSQSSFVTASKITSSSSQITAEESSGFTSFSSKSKSVTYGIEELTVINDIRQASQQTYIQKQFTNLFSFATESLSGLENLVESSSSNTTDGSDETGENELSTLLSQIAVTLSVLNSNVDSLDFGSLTEFSSAINEIRSFVDSTYSITQKQLSDSLNLISLANNTLSSQIQSSEKYSIESQRFLNIQQSSSLVTEFTEIVSRIESESANTSIAGDINGSNFTETYEILLKYSKSITLFLTEYSLKRSSITEKAIKTFTESVKFFSSFQNFSGISIPDIKIWQSFLKETKSTTRRASSYSASKGSILRSKTQKDLLLNNRAKKAVNDYLTILRNLSTSLDGTTESTSPSKNQLVRILSESLQISKHFEVGRIESYQVIQYEKYIRELSPLIVLLRGTKILTEITTLETSLTLSQKTIEASLIDIEREAIEDESDTQLDNVYQIYTQISSFIGNQISIISENNNSFGNTTDSQYSSIEGNITSLLNIFRESDNIFTVDTQQIYTIFSSLVFSLQTISRTELIVQFQELLLEVKKREEFVKVERESIVFDRTVSSVSRLASVIPNTFSISGQQYDNLVYLDDIERIQGELHIFRRQIYSITRSDIRIISRLQFTLKSIIETYGFNIAYLSSITETLSQIKTAAEKYKTQSLIQSNFKESVTIYSTTSEDITNVENSIKRIISSGETSLETGVDPDDAIEGAFYYLINNTLDYTQLPRDLGSVIGNFSFGTSQTSGKVNYIYLTNILRILKRLTELNNQATESLRYIERASHVTEINGLITTIIEKLKEFIGSTSYSSNITEGSGYDTSTQSSSINVSESTVDENEGAYEDNGEDSPMTIDDVVQNTLSIADEFFANGLVLEESNLEDLNYYSTIISSLPITVGQNIKDLPDVINHLSQTSFYLIQAIHAFESAYQVSESYSLLKDVFEINTLIKQALENSSSSLGTAQINGLIKSIEEYYEVFTKGFAFITKLDVNACFGLVYELNSLGGITGDTEINSQSLLYLVEQSENTLLEAKAFLSAHYHYYQQALFTEVIDDVDNTVEAIKNLELSSSSQLTYILFEIDSLLSNIIDKLYNPNPTAESSSSPSSDNNTEPVVFSETIAVLKAAESNLNGLQLSTLYRLAAILSDLDFSNEDETFLNNFSLFIVKIKGMLSFTANIIGDYGKSSTQVLLLQELSTILNDTSVKAKKWIYKECETDCSKVDLITNSPLVTSTSANNVYPTTISPNSSITVLDSESVQKSFEQASDILIYWSFDSSSIDFKSVSQFKAYMKSLEDTCQLVKGLHLWDHILISSNVTLLSLLQDVYLKQKIERAATEEALLRYENALEVLRATSEISSEVPENNTEPTTTQTSDISSMSTNEFSEDAVETAEIEIPISSRINTLITLSNLIIGRAIDADYNIRRYEIEALNSYQSNFNELVKAGGVLSEYNIDYLLNNALQAENQTEKSVETLYQFSVQSSKSRAHELGQSFFQQTKLLVLFSISIISDLKNISSVNGSTTSLNASVSSEQSTISSLEDCGNLLCKSERLRDSLLLLSGEDGSTTAYPTTLGGYETSITYETTNGVDGNNITFMDSYIHEQFIYGETRSLVYAFTRALLKLGDEDPGVYDEVLDTLEESVGLLDDQLNKIESQAVTTSVDISSYVYISF